MGIVIIVERIYNINYFRFFGNIILLSIMQVKFKGDPKQPVYRKQQL